MAFLYSHMQQTDDRRARVSSEAASGCGRLVTGSCRKAYCSREEYLRGLLETIPLRSFFPDLTLVAAFPDGLEMHCLPPPPASNHSLAPSRIGTIAHGNAAEFATPRLVRVGS